MEDLIKFDIKFDNFETKPNQENGTSDDNSIVNDDVNLLDTPVNEIDTNIALIDKLQNNDEKPIEIEEEENIIIKDVEFYSGSSEEEEAAELLSDDSDCTVSVLKFKNKKLKGVEGYEWKLCKNGDFPDDAVEGGTNIDGKIYIARIHHSNGSILIGKLLPKHKRAYSYLNEQIQSKEYEVLCDQNTKWINFKTSYIFPRNVIFGGYDIINKRYFYIGRARHLNHFIVGKVDVTTKICYILSKQKEYKYYDYELLISTRKDERKQIGELTKLPSTDLEKFELIELSENSKKYIEIIQIMKETIQSHANLTDIRKYKIDSILKVHNIDLLEAFKSKKDELEEPNIMKLFHGSKNCKEIAQNGFSFNSANTTALFGQGIYFAKSSSKSNQYSPCNLHSDKNCSKCIRSMLYCRVILGKSLELKTENKNYSPTNPPEGYDSITGVPSVQCLKYHEYTIYDKNQVYPDYIINYKVIHKK